MPSLLAILFGRRASLANAASMAVEAATHDADDHASSTLPDVFQRVEMAQVARHRRAVGLAPETHVTDVPGIAISGGGIRSAVFALGVLQAMADRDALKQFGFVSTVSGGSYIGSFYGSLFVPDALRTAQRPAPASTFQASARLATAALRPKTAAPQGAITPLSYLRDNCNYLAPNGLTDILQSITFSLRNWFALQYVIGVSLLTVLLWISLVNYAFFDITAIAAGWPPILKSLPGLLAIAVSMLLVSPLSRAYWLTQNLAQETRTPFKFLPFLSLCIVIGIALATLDINAPGTLPALFKGHFAALLPSASAVGVGARMVILTELLSIIAFGIACLYATRDRRPGTAMNLRGTSRFDSRAFADRLRNWLTNAYTTPFRIGQHRLFSGPVQIMIWTAGIAVIDALGQLGYACAGGSPRHPFGAGSNITCILTGWSAPVADASGNTGVAAMLGILAASGGGIWAAAKFLLSNGASLSGTLMKIPRLVLASVAAFLAALLTLTFWSIASRAVSGALHGYLNKTTFFSEFISTSRYAHDQSTVFLGLLAITCVVILILATIDGVCIQFLNLSTYQRFYSVRLTRAFIGATNATRLNNDEARDVTSLVHGDNIPMGAYFNEQTCSPVHLINTTINKTVDWNSSLVQRGSRGLIMSVGPAGMTIGAKLGVLKCEWTQASDVSTKAAHIMNGTTVSNIWLESLTLGDWVAISGAAVSTGLGQLTRPGYSLLLGIANIRLGYWWDTLSAPIERVTRRNPPQRVPLPDATPPRRYFRERWFGTQFCLSNELLGQFDGPRARRWYLTDGGHFENTGAYELLRRGLSLVVIFDNGCDPTYTFDDIAALIRRVRVDFGVEITESPCRFAPHPAVTLNPALIARSFDEFSSNPKYLALRLMSAFPGGRTGQILVIKPRLTPVAPYDVRQYKTQNPSFPHETTVDQFFDDVQWESHRQLGYSQGRALFG